MMRKTFVQFPSMAFRNGNSLIIGGNTIPQFFEKNDFFRDAVVSRFKILAR